MKALRTVVGLGAVGYAFAVLAASLLRLLGVAPQATWRVGVALTLVVWVPVCGWVLWQALRGADRSPPPSPAGVGGPPTGEPPPGAGPLDWAGEVDHLLETSRLRGLRTLADEAATSAAGLVAAVDAAWQHGSFDVELAARARAAQAAADIATTNLAFATIVAGERLRGSRAGLAS